MAQKELQPLVSVIIPVYNPILDFLRQCLESVTSQTYRNLEIIIIMERSGNKENDSNTIQLIRSYNDPRIILLDESKIGVAYARNVGISRSKGKFLALMDADDVCELHRIQRQVEFFDNHDADIVGSYVKVIDEENKILGTAKVPLDPKEIRRSLMICSPFFGSTTMIKKEILKNEKYDESFPLASDYEFYIRLISKGIKCHNINEPLVRVRENYQSLMRKQYMKLNYYTIKARLKGISLGLCRWQDLVYFFITIPAIFFSRKAVLFGKKKIGKLFSREIIAR